MILVDFAHLYNRLVYVSVINSKGKKKNGKFSTEDFKGLLVHNILTNLLYLKSEFKEYGELVLCLEGGSWRKDIFPEYKAHRKKDGEESEIDWKEVYEILDDLTSNLSENFGVMCLKVIKAEGDDLIAVLSSLDENSLIVSSDKDFKQLLKHKHIKIFDPIKKEMISSNFDPKELLKHIIRGDEVDNIPSILSKNKFSPEFISYLEKNDIWISIPKDFFNLSCSEELVEKYDIYEKYISGKNKGLLKDSKLIFKKQVLTQKKLEELIEKYENDNLGDLEEAFKQNQKLIDFSYIPSEIKEKIKEEFNFIQSNKKKKNQMRMMEFCFSYNLSSILSNLQNF